MKPRILGILGALCLLLLLAAGARRWFAPPQRQRTTPAPPPAANHANVTGADPQPERDPASISTALPLVGMIVAGRQATLSSQSGGRIASVPVYLGERVRANSLLVTLDSSALRAQAQTAAAGIGSAQAQEQKAKAALQAAVSAENETAAASRLQVQEAAEKLRQARLQSQEAAVGDAADLTQAQADLKKTQVALKSARENQSALQRLSAVGGVAQSDLDAAGVQVRSAEEDERAAAARVHRLQAVAPSTGGATLSGAIADAGVQSAQIGVREATQQAQSAAAARRTAAIAARADLRAAHAAVVQARAAAEAAQVALRTATLRSPIDGYVTALQARSGETAAPAAPLVTVVSTEAPYAEALATARQLERLRVGDRARVSVDTAPGRSFSATLTSLAHMAEPGGRTFRVRFRLQNGAALRPGQLAGISVEAGR